MADLDAVHEEIYRIREETDASREVRERLTSIERSLSGMESSQEPPDPAPDRLREIRAEIDRLADEVDYETAAELDRLRELVREFERKGT